MSWRGLGVAVLLALVGAAAGVGLARVLDDDPVAVAEVVPAVATDPSVPTDPPVQVLPDPTTPPLATDLPTHVATVGQKPFGLSLPVPDGWTRSDPKAGEWRWFVESNPLNTYVLRVVLPSGYASIGTALQTRIDALDGATGIQEFTVESQTADTFIATYVSEGHRRLTMERFLSLDGSQTVYANVALVGRMVDRDGMADLLDRITAEARR
jgi:hypothetical protein